MCANSPCSYFPYFLATIPFSPPPLNKQANNSKPASTSEGLVTSALCKWEETGKFDKLHVCNREIFTQYREL